MSEPMFSNIPTGTPAPIPTSNTIVKHVNTVIAANNLQNVQKKMADKGLDSVPKK